MGNKFGKYFEEFMSKEQFHFLLELDKICEISLLSAEIYLLVFIGLI